MKPDAELTAARARQLAELIEARGRPARSDEGGDAAELIATLVAALAAAGRGSRDETLDVDLGEGRHLSIDAPADRAAVAYVSRPGADAGAAPERDGALPALDAAIDQLDTLRF